MGILCFHVVEILGCDAIDIIGVAVPTSVLPQEVTYYMYSRYIYVACRNLDGTMALRCCQPTRCTESSRETRTNHLFIGLTCPSRLPVQRRHREKLRTGDRRIESDTRACQTLYLLLIGLTYPVGLYILLRSPHYSYIRLPTFSQSKVERLRFRDSSSPPPKRQIGGTCKSTGAFHISLPLL